LNGVGLKVFSLMNKEFINPLELPNWEQAFSQIIIVTSGATKTIYISGQVSVDKGKKLIGAGDLGIQAIQAFENLQSALIAAGATTADVVKLNIYVKDYRQEDAPLVSKALRKCFPQKKLPTSTWLGVQSLGEEGFLIEVDAIAVLEQE
jgi:enamine deaminase RidA (YjgF/YER057c/UK114 family)